ncbi:hypothetical protein Aperf_G00000084972 [Anoplocephala perfoliata]
MAYRISGAAYYAAYERHRVPMQDWSGILHKPRLTYSNLALIQSTMISGSSLSTLLKKIQNLTCILFESTVPLMSVKVIIPVYFHCQDFLLVDVEAVSDGSTDSQALFQSEIVVGLLHIGSGKLSMDIDFVVAQLYNCSQVPPSNKVLHGLHLDSLHPRSMDGVPHMSIVKPHKAIYFTIPSFDTGVWFFF